jgi:UDP-glucose 4-epimerase
MKNVLIAGGAGFVGSHLVRRLLAMPEIAEIMAIDDFSSGDLDALPLPDEKLQILEWDIGDGLPAELTGYDTVFHLASNADIALAATEPEVDFERGTVLTQRILEFCRLTRASRLIYFSGSGVYGENADCCFDENYGPCMPISTYGASKLAGEAMVSAYCHMFGLSAISFRPANLVGPGQTHGVGFDFMQRLKADPARLEVRGDGFQRKAYLHIDDMLDAVFLANAQHKKGFDVFNVSCEFQRSVSLIAIQAMQVLGLDPNKVKLEFTGGSRGWAGDVPKIGLNYDKIKALGWEPKYNSISAMQAALESMK